MSVTLLVSAHEYRAIANLANEVYDRDFVVHTDSSIKTFAKHKMDVYTTWHRDKEIKWVEGLEKIIPGLIKEIGFWTEINLDVVCR